MEVAPDGPVTETHNSLSAQTPICQVTTPKIQKANSRLVMKSKAEFLLKHVLKGRNSSVSRASNWNAKHNTEAVSHPRSSKGSFPQRQPLVPTPWWYLYSPLCNRVRQHLCTKHKQSYIPLLGHTKILHTLIEMASPALAAVAPLINQIGRPTFPANDKEVLIKIT